MTEPCVGDVDRYALWDAAYVLGSLSSSERREYENHLSGCSSCRSAVGELGGMPGLLAMLSPDDVAGIDDDFLDGSVEHPGIRPQVLDGLLNDVRRRRRTIRWSTWAASAAAVVLVTVGTVIALRPETPAPEPSLHAAATPVSMTPVAPSSVEATVSMASRAWGTFVALSCTYREEEEEVPGTREDDDGDRLAMVAVGRDGTRDQLATWMAREGVTASPTGSTSMSIDAIASVQVVATDTGDVLLQRDF